MKMACVTVSGIDNGVSPKDIKKISAEFPFVEFGILLSKSNAGKKRYPDDKWLKRLAAAAPNSRLSGHLCGAYVKELLKGKDSISGNVIFPALSRIQINLKGIEGVSAQPLKSFFNLLSTFQNQGKKIIFQVASGRSYLCRSASLRGVNVLPLFDASGGNGISPVRWPTPWPETLCGYAGGLSPENLQQELNRIEEVAGDAKIWIDAESGLRTDDNFDLEKARAFLKIIENQIKGGKK